MGTTRRTVIDGSLGSTGSSVLLVPRFCWFLGFAGSSVLPGGGHGAQEQHRAAPGDGPAQAGRDPGGTAGVAGHRSAEAPAGRRRRTAGRGSATGPAAEFVGRPQGFQLLQLRRPEYGLRGPGRVEDRSGTARSGDGDDRGGTVQQPGQSESLGTDAVVGRDAVEGGVRRRRAGRTVQGTPGSGLCSWYSPMASTPRRFREASAARLR
ncbi:hypothetical protein GCM10009536_49810 [Streptomyces thermocarboxydus]